MMNKRNVVLLAVLVLLVVAIGGIWRYKQMGQSSKYSVVYLVTGEVYVGHLTTFPDLELKDSYILQVTKDTVDPTKSNFQLQPISQALWAPAVLHLTEKNVVFYGPILTTSKIGQALAGK